MVVHQNSMCTDPSISPAVSSGPLEIDQHMDIYPEIGDNLSCIHERDPSTLKCFVTPEDLVMEVVDLPYSHLEDRSPRVSVTVSPVCAPTPLSSATVSASARDDQVISESRHTTAAKRELLSLSLKIPEIYHPGGTVPSFAMSKPSYRPVSPPLGPIGQSARPAHGESCLDKEAGGQGRPISIPYV